MTATAKNVVVELRPNLAQLCRECLEGAGGDRDKAAAVLSDMVLNDQAARAAFFDSAILYWAREIIIRETGKERAAIYAQQARMPVTDGSTFRAAVVENARRFMEIPLWGGKPIGFATAAEIRASAAEHRKQAKTYGERAAWQMAALKFDLATRVKRPSKRPIPLANIKPTQAQATALLVIYARVLAAWSAGIGSVVDEYERTIATMTQDSAGTTGDAIDGIAAEIQRLVLLLTPDLRRWAVRMEAVHRGKWVQSVLSATDVDLNTILTAGDVEDTVGASVNWNISLIRDVSDELRRRIANAVFAGFQRRAPAAEIAKEIRQATGMARSRARRIAGDQTVKLGARLNQARQEQAGITSFKWRHSAKRHPRSWHLQRDGKVYPWRSNSIPADDMPGVPPFCGCTAQGVITFDE